MASGGVVLIDQGLFGEIVRGKKFFLCSFAQQLFCTAAGSLKPLTVLYVKMGGVTVMSLITGL